jgi:twitching motility protein PilT
MIRESKVHQIDTVINASSSTDGMVGMDNSILKLYKSGVISKENALAFAEAPELMERKFSAES